MRRPRGRLSAATAIIKGESGDAMAGEYLTSGNETSIARQEFLIYQTVILGMVPCASLARLLRFADYAGAASRAHASGHRRIDARRGLLRMLMPHFRSTTLPCGSFATERLGRARA